MASPERQPERLHQNGLGPLPPDPRTVEEVKVTEVFVDRNAQREVDNERVAQIAQEFDWNRFEMPTCNRRKDGTLVVDEGQHRVLGLRRRDPKASLRVLVIPEGLSLAGEASIGLAIAAKRKPHTALNKWELRVRRQDKHEVLAEEVLREHNLRLGQKASPTALACVGVIYTMIHANRQTPEAGAATLDIVLGIIESAYPKDQPDSATPRWNHHIVRAVSMLVLRHPNLKAARLAGVLRNRIAQQWISQAESSDVPAWQKIAESLAAGYNKGLRTMSARIGAGE